MIFFGFDTKTWVIPSFLLKLFLLASFIHVTIPKSDMPVHSAPLSPQLSREIAAFESMIAADPKNASLKYTIGLLYQLAGKPQQVCDHLYGVYLMDPSSASPDLFFHLANNLKAIGETEAAVNFYALAIGAAPVSPVHWVLMSIALDFLGRPDLALRGYQVRPAI